MKVVILAGGRGTRISEESSLRPKPMVPIGGMPIIWHIMKIYSSYGFNEFIICCGYKGEYIKKYFVNYVMKCKSTKFDFTSRNDDFPKITTDSSNENWKIVLANTGLNTLTAGRIKKIEEYIGDDEEFMLTYGDGVADIDISKLIKFHRSAGKILTISTTQPEGRFGAIKIENGIVNSFQEKARQDQSYVNIGFMVMNRKIFEYLGDGLDMLEREPFEKLASIEQMAAYKHDGFWSPMDNINDRAYLEKLWRINAPWKVW